MGRVSAICVCREGGGFTAASAGSWYNCNSKLVHQKTIPLPAQSLFIWFECLTTSLLQVLLFSLDDSDCNLHAMQSSKITNFQTINVVGKLLILHLPNPGLLYLLKLLVKITHGRLWSLTIAITLLQPTTPTHHKELNYSNHPTATHNPDTP